MPLIAIAHGEKLEDYRQAILHVGGEVRLVDGSARRGRGARRSRRPPADRRRRRRACAIRRGAGAGARHRRCRPRRVRNGVDRRGAPARPSDPRHLPRHSGAERRLRRVARAGHRRPGAGAMPHSFKVPEHESYYLAHEVWLDKDSLLERLMRERLSDSDACDVNSRHHQAVQAAWRPASSSRRRRPTASSKRSKIRRRRFASASSGIRKISGAPANSARCSKGSSLAATKPAA